MVTDALLMAAMAEVANMFPLPVLIVEKAIVAVELAFQC